MLIVVFELPDNTPAGTIASFAETYNGRITSLGFSGSFEPGEPTSPMSPEEEPPSRPTTRKKKRGRKAKKKGKRSKTAKTTNSGSLPPLRRRKMGIGEGHARRLSDKDIERLQKMRARGYGVSEIAEATGLSKHSVSRHTQ